jgi:hypothetical protein
VPILVSLSNPSNLAADVNQTAAPETRGAALVLGSWSQTAHARTAAYVIAHVRTRDQQRDSGAAIPQPSSVRCVAAVWLLCLLLQRSLSRAQDAPRRAYPDQRLQGRNFVLRQPEDHGLCALQGLASLLLRCRWWVMTLQQARRPPTKTTTGLYPRGFLHETYVPRFWSRGGIQILWIRGLKVDKLKYTTELAPFWYDQSKINSNFPPSTVKPTSMLSEVINPFLFSSHDCFGLRFCLYGAIVAMKKMPHHLL